MDKRGRMHFLAPFNRSFKMALLGAKKCILTLLSIGKQQSGFTLLELSVVVTVIGVVSAMAIPRFGRTMEESRVEQASNQLKSIWSAQRIYWLKFKSYTTDLDVLFDEGLLGKDIQDAASADCIKCNFSYSMLEADDETFTVAANRVNSGKWKGQIQINLGGELSGEIKDLSSDYTIPASRYE